MMDKYDGCGQDGEIEDSFHYSTTGKTQKMIRARFELATFCVLDRCDNQLRHRTDTCSSKEVIIRSNSNGMISKGTS